VFSKCGTELGKVTTLFYNRLNKYYDKYILLFQETSWSWSIQINNITIIYLINWSPTLIKSKRATVKECTVKINYNG
jgi:hypothetical protein